MNKDMTYSEAIEQVMTDNGKFAPLRLLYEEVWKYKDKDSIKGKTPENTIQERVQRDTRFRKVSRGIYALTSFIEKIDKEDIGNFEFNSEGILTFKKRNPTERLTETKIRIGQEKFRFALLKETKKCPITGIDDERLLIASHIKPWSHSDNKERLDSKNGLLLSPLFDKLFDKNVGLITFTPQKEILISKKLSAKNIKLLNISNRQVFDDLPIDGRENFLEYHRKYIFEK